MGMNFPNVPVPGQIYASPSGPVYRFDDPVWTVVTTAEGDDLALFGDITPEMFGAAGDGVTDDSVAIGNAFAYVVARGGGKVYFRQKYYVTSTVTVPAKCTMRGDMGRTTGAYTSAIIGALALMPIVLLDGGGAGASTAIEGVVVDRVAGTVPDDAVGIQVINSDGPRIVDCFIKRQAYAIDIYTHHTSHHLERVQTTVCHKAHLRLRGGAGVTVMDCYFGMNGGIDVNCDSYVEVDLSGGGNVDTVNFVRTQFNQSGTGKVKRLLDFKSYHVNGGFTFVSCHAEGFDPASAVVIRADAASTVLRSISFDSTTDITTSNTTRNFFDVPDTTVLILFQSRCDTIFNYNFPNNASQDIRVSGYANGNINVPAATALQLGGTYCLGNLTLGPGAVNKIASTGFYIHGTTTLSGTLNGVLHGNFNGAVTDTSTGELDLTGRYGGAEPLVGTRFGGRYMQLTDVKPFRVWDILGTTDASGNALAAHGIGGTGAKRIRFAQAYYQNVAGVTLPMTVNFIDGINVSISNAAAVSRPYVVSLMIARTDYAGW